MSPPICPEKRSQAREQRGPDEPRAFTLESRHWLLAGGLGLAKLAIHLPVLTRYGYHHDELYFLACGQHFDLGYVDHPPLVPWMARLAHELFGQSLFGLRLFASLAVAFSAVLLALLCRRLGGGPWAMVVATGSWMLGPVALRTGNLFCIPAFEVLFWLLASHALVSVIDKDRPRAWSLVGLACGVGLLVKHSLFFFGMGLVVALVAVPRLRGQFRQPWLYAGGAIAFACLLPNLVWQALYGWPTVTFLQAQADVVDSIGRGQFLAGQLLFQGLGGFLVWMPGLIFFFSRAGKRFRYLGWIYIAVLVFLLIVKSKIYYLSPAYPALFAGGGVALESWARGLRWPRLVWIGLPTFVLGMAIVGLPISLPILDIDSTESMIRTATFGKLDNVYELTADLRGMFGWQERVDAVAEVHASLPEEERERALIIASWYGPAGALDYFGPQRGLPPVISTHMSYHLWGIPEGDWQPLIAVDIPLADLERHFDSVTLAKRIELEDVNPWDREFSIYVCRSPKSDLRQAWPELGRYGH